MLRREGSERKEKRRMGREMNEGEKRKSGVHDAGERRDGKGKDQKMGWRVKKFRR